MEQSLNDQQQVEAATIVAATSQGQLSPVGARERILTLDVLRGFALLGICMVNMPFFTMPFMDALIPPDQAHATKAETAAWFFVATLFEYKFISMFSLMFGMGLILQMNRANAASRPFAPVYIRRLVVLAWLGLMHGFLLWYGDILFLYAIVGFILFLCRGLSARALLMTSGGVLVLMLTVQSLFIALGMLFGGGQWMQGSPPSTTATVQGSFINSLAIERDESVFFTDAPRLDSEGSTKPANVNDGNNDSNSEPAHGFDLILKNPNPSSDAWRQGETHAYREGPFVDALAFRAVSFVFALAWAVFGYGWRVLAMFLLGAALMKLDFFRPSRRAWHQWIAVLGIGLGLPLEAAHKYLSMQAENDIGWIHLPMVWMHELGSLALCLGYAGAVTLMVQSGCLSWLAKALSCVGRMALTNYLAHTVIATSIMYWWGLGMFGEVARPGQVMLVLAIYTCQLLVSVVWLTVFNMGPIEWLWRSLTYGRPQLILRRRQTVEA